MPDHAPSPPPSRAGLWRRIRDGYAYVRYRLDELTVRIFFASSSVIGIEAFFVLLDLWPLMPYAVPLLLLTYASVYVVRRLTRRRAKSPTDIESDEERR